jgi:hypothetical protein
MTKSVRLQAAAAVAVVFTAAAVFSILSSIFGSQHSLPVLPNPTNPDNKPFYVSEPINPQTRPQLQLEGLMMQAPRISASSSSSSSALKERAATPTVHMLQALQGNKTGFIDQWEVNLKSVLLNAPLDANLHIHILSNAAAKEAVLERIQAAGLEGSPWRNQVSITVYNVEKYQAELTKLILKKNRGNAIDQRVTLGGYYRLLAYQVIPNHNSETIGPILYMDADVVVLANLNDL